MNSFNKILAIGAHPDDIEYSCLGFLLAHNKKGSKITSLICSYGAKNDPSSSIERIKESKKSLSCIKNLDFHFFKQTGIEINQYEILSNKIRDLILKKQPDLILTHDENDTNQEHRILNNIVLTAARRLKISILKFCSPSSSQEFSPNVYVDISKFYKKKVRFLKEHKSQSHHDYFSEEYLDIFHKSRYSKTHSLKYVEQFKLEKLII